MTMSEQATYIWINKLLIENAGVKYIEIHTHLEITEREDRARKKLYFVFHYK